MIILLSVTDNWDTSAFIRGKESLSLQYDIQEGSSVFAANNSMLLHAKYELTNSIKNSLNLEHSGV